MTTTLTLNSGGPYAAAHVTKALSVAVAAAFGSNGHGNVPTPPEYLEPLEAVIDCWQALVRRSHGGTARAFELVVTIIDANPNHAPPETIQVAITTAATAGTAAPSGTLEVV